MSIGNRRMTIRSVTIQGVRGIRTPLTFVLDGQSFLLHGDNGTGKSSFERGLRWVLTGEGEPTPDEAFTTEESFRRHIEVKVDYPAVTVTLMDGSTVSVTNTGVSSTGKGAAFRAASRLARPFLRRAELLNVLTSKPAERFAYFESFLALEKVDATITELAGTKASLEARRTQLTQKLSGALEPIRALLPTGGKQPESLAEVLAEAASFAKSLHLQVEGQSYEAIAAIAAEAADAAARGDTARTRGRLEQFLVTGGEIQKRLPVDAGLEWSQVIEQERALEQSGEDAKVITLLEHAAAHFAVAEGTTCPVCESTIDWVATRASLRKRSEALARLRQVRKRKTEIAMAIHRSLSEVLTLASDVALLLRADISPLTFLGVDDPRIAGLAGASPVDASSVVAQLTVLGPDQVVGAIRTALASSDERCTAAIKSLPLPSDTPALQTAKALFGLLPRAVPQLKLLNAEASTRSRELELIEQVLLALKRSRQDVAKETFASIENQVAEYYFEIHPQGTPDDATGAPSIDVQRHGKGTAFVRGRFHGREVKDPQWVYSDGHLDTVGICIFLALRRFRSEQPNDPRLMVLDDIIISIDLGHARRLITLLKTRFKDHQILILTHNGLFAHWCKNLLPGIRRVDITGWSLADGPQVGSYPSAKENIEKAISTGSPKEIALRLMALLDEWTGEARYDFALAVPARPGEQYTLADIWVSFAKCLKEVGKQLNSDLGGALTALDTIPDVVQIRNLLAAHENEFAKEFPRQVMVDTARAALVIYNAIYCEQCAAFATPTPNRQSAAIMHCPGHHIQYVKPKRGDS